MLIDVKYVKTVAVASYGCGPCTLPGSSSALPRRSRPVHPEVIQGHVERRLSERPKRAEMGRDNGVIVQDSAR